MRSGRSLVQLGYAVADAREAAANWSRRTGAGPFFVRMHFAIASARHDGSPATFDHSAAFGQWGDVQVELIEQHQVEPPALARILRPGEQRLHHVTWFADDLERESERLTAAGCPQVLDVTTAAGTRFMFHDARAELGHLIELYEATERVRAHYASVADAARDWDGRDPVRDG
jgi:Glyoxalase/Bleomycin resistance protein/Dioxygenase superfamily